MGTASVTITMPVLHLITARILSLGARTSISYGLMTHYSVYRYVNEFG